MDNTDLFTSKAAIYHNGRPSYPDELLQFLQRKFQITHETIIADIGAGTGKFTEELLELGCHVIAVEPNQKMAEELRDGLLCEQLTIRERPAEHTEIDDHSVNIITVAQAFHWFNKEAFKLESKRILVEDGPICLIWNMRVEDALINKRTKEVFEKHCPKFEGFSGGMTHNENQIEEFFNHGYEFFEIDFPLTFKKKQFVERCLSASYALNPEDDGFKALKDDLKAIFNEFAEEDKVIIPNKTKCYYGYI